MRLENVFDYNNTGCVGGGYISLETDNTDRDFGRYYISYITFDGNVDDGTYSTLEEAKVALKKAIKDSIKISKEYSRRASLSPTGMY